MNSPRNEDKQGFSAGNLAERHHRRGYAATTTTSAPGNSGRRRGLPNDLGAEREAEEIEYQARYERELQERRQKRANERREARQKEIVSGRVIKPKNKSQLDDAIVRGVKIFALALVALILLISAVMAYDKFSSSRLFIIKEIDLQGTKKASREELLRVLASYKTQSLWQLDLPAIRAAVEKNPWVLEAEVSRVLPDALRVTVHEREPIAPARTANNSVVWVDRDGRSLGELDFNQTNQVPPVVDGLDEGSGEETKLANHRRMEIYQQVLRELDQTSPKLSEEIDEINLKDVQAVKLHLLKRNVTVMVGEAEFRTRLEKALKVLDAVERKDLSALGLLKVSDAEKLVSGNRIAYLNITRPEHVVVGFAE